MPVLESGSATRGRHGPLRRVGRLDPRRAHNDRGLADRWGSMTGLWSSTMWTRSYTLCNWRLSDCADDPADAYARACTRLEARIAQVEHSQQTSFLRAHGEKRSAIRSLPSNLTREQHHGPWSTPQGITARRHLSGGPRPAFERTARWTRLMCPAPSVPSTPARTWSTCQAGVHPLWRRAQVCRCRNQAGARSTTDQDDGAAKGSFIVTNDPSRVPQTRRNTGGGWQAGSRTARRSQGAAGRVVYGADLGRNDVGRVAVRGSVSPASWRSGRPARVVTSSTVTGTLRGARLLGRAAPPRSRSAPSRRPKSGRCR